jgi:hypothetical protein
MYISIDVGIKNLAYVIYNDTIVEWKVIELCTTNASKANIIDIGKKLFEALRELTYTFTEAIIENQIGPNAIRMKGLQGMITMFFISKGVNVTYWNAANKLKQFTKEKMTYSERKKLSIHITRQLVEKSFNTNLEYFNSHKKKDDLADCFLQLIDFLNKKGIKNIICNELNIKL